MRRLKIRKQPNLPLNLPKTTPPTLAGLLLLICGWGLSVQPVQAEGSKELVAQGGNRPYLEWWPTNSTAGIPRKNTLQVFVKQGEIVNLGSSVHNAPSNQDIIYTSPFGTDNGSCNVVNTGSRTGFIDTLTKETIGPEVTSGDGGYVPCKFTAKETGIYQVEFRSPQGTGDPPIRTTSASFPTDSSQRATVAAWDITVRDSNGNTKNGRVFTNYIAMNMGGGGTQLNSKFYVQTKDGFRYLTEMNGLDPYGFIFFANSRGFIDTTNQSTLYRSAKASDATLASFEGNVQVQNPNLADTETNITHLIFFNPPDTDTLIALGIPTTAIAPAVPSDFKFTGRSGSSGNQTPVNVGGYFSFTSSGKGSYEIIIDTNNDGKFDPSSDRVLQNPASSGVNVVDWDGRDANGVALQPLPGNLAYNARVSIRGGEYHFPLLDVENNPNGIKITMQNPPTSFPTGIVDQNGQPVGSTTIYYNDSNYTTVNGTSVNLDGTGATNPRNASMGINSATGEHEFSSNYGDFKGIDTWAYFPSAATSTPLVITTSNQANVRGTKSVRFLTDEDGSNSVTVGDTVEYTITYSNLAPGNSDAINFEISDSLPSQLTYQPGSATITNQTAGNAIALNPSYDGTGKLTQPGTLRVGDTITITLKAKINTSNNGNAISNQASATFSTPDNPTATAGTVITDALSAPNDSNNPSVGNNFLQVDDTLNTGNDPISKTDDDPTLFKVVPGVGELTLVKRITRINNNTTYKGTNLAQVFEDPNSTNDNKPQWPADYLQGGLSGLVVEPGDEVEYTIYYLSSGQSSLNSVTLCDLIPTNSTFISDGFAPGAGIVLSRINSTSNLTNITDSDPGTFIDLGNAAPAACNRSAISANPNSPPPPLTAASNTTGAVVVNITPGASNLAVGDYGFFRFRVKVK